MILATEPDGQILIYTEDEFKDKKDYYSLKEIGTIDTELSKDELFQRLVYPIALPEKWYSEMKWKY